MDQKGLDNWKLNMEIKFWLERVRLEGGAWNGPIFNFEFEFESDYYKTPQIRTDFLNQSNKLFCLPTRFLKLIVMNGSELSPGLHSSFKTEPGAWASF